jgi:hypothetical protein
MTHAQELNGLIIADEEWPFPLKCNPWYLEVRGSANEWFLSFQPFTSVDDNEFFIETDVPWLASVTLPSANPERLRDACDLMALLLYQDDEFDTASGRERAEIISAAMDILTDRPNQEKNLWAVPFGDVWNRIRSRVSDKQMEKLQQEFTNYLLGCQTMTGLADGESFTLLDGYLSVRRNSIAGGINCFLVEYALDIELPVEILEHPLSHRLVEAHLDYTIVLQDLLSYLRESNEGIKENIIDVLRHIHGCSVQEAINRAHDLFQLKVTEFEISAEKVRAEPWGVTSELNSYIEGMRDFTSGLIAWTTHSRRYKQIGPKREVISIGGQLP